MNNIDEDDLTPALDGIIGVAILGADSTPDKAIAKSFCAIQLLAEQIQQMLADDRSTEATK